MREDLITNAQTQPFPEHSEVVLRRDVESKGILYPRSTPGVVVHVYRSGRDYEVEVFTPHNVVLTLDSDDISQPPGVMIDVEQS